MERVHVTAVQSVNDKEDNDAMEGKMADVEEMSEGQEDKE